MKHNLIYAQGGGPTAVINASLAGVINEAQKQNDIDKILICRHGVEGLMKEDFIDCTNLTANELKRLKYTPGSAPGSCRYKVSQKDYQRILEVFKNNNVKYFLYNGGNDSMDTCNKISIIAKDIRAIGIPKTIDNDLAGTDHSPGFGCAARYSAIVTLELGLDVCALPIHVVVIEVMGRNTGWLVAATALARVQGFKAPHLIYFPERAFDKEQFIEDVKTARAKYGTGIVVAVSEGIRGKDGKIVSDSGIIDGFGHTIPGGTARELSNLLMKAKIRSRSEKPGLILRASKLIVSEIDRKEAFIIGQKSVRVALENKSGYMTGFKRISDNPYKINIELIPLSDVANIEKTLPDNFINEAGNDVTEEFIKYCKPLVGKDFPIYYKFCK